MAISAEIKITGIVQGVGFRPFVHKLAEKFNLRGRVYNRSGSVIIEATGSKNSILAFYRSIETNKPPAASIDSVKIKYLKKNFKYTGFSISASKPSAELKAVPPDLAICPDCLSELFDKKDRRHLYPFINCTNCGPRFTIILDTPYDRKNTTMNDFRMCPDCAAEYENIKNRRYHAEPNACPVCGPAVFLKGQGMPGISGNKAMEIARKFLKQGKILAIKGLGGFHIAVDASNQAAVEELKKRKRRSNKPLAVMSDSIAKIRKYALVTPAAERLLRSSTAPIVLLEKRKNRIIAGGIAGGLAHIGAFLAYTPMHRLLFDEKITALVMTSANMAEEPIQHDNDEAARELKGIADYFLYHNRDINMPADDSVIKPYGGKSVFIRRSRGYVPEPIKVSASAKSVIGAGALLKSTVCFIKSNNAIMSQHIGDLENNRAYSYYKKTIDDFIRFYEIEPETIVRDMHPDYLSSVFAGEFASARGIPCLQVQHHHAHLISVLAENNHAGKAIGVIFDGTGYGTDGNIWGGEFLAGDFSGFERLAHLKYMKLPGGDAAGREAYRSAISLLSGFMDEKQIRKMYPDYDVKSLMQMINKNINSPLSSGAGRLFDAVASLAGACDISTYEAEAPMRLEALAFGYKGRVRPYRFTVETPLVGVSEGETGTSPVSTKPPFVIDLTPAIKQIVKDRKTRGSAYIAAAFHATMAHVIQDTVNILSKETGIRDVALSGGVFQNTILLEQAIKLLKKGGFNVLIHEKLSPNDSSIALGQAVFGSQNLKVKSQK
jgi:hydrogenase maturation protein HypF